jgi:CBS domain containing-hemolysin-like protein
MALLLTFLILALLLSFLCSVMEAVLLSAPRSYLMVQMNTGKRWAGHFNALKRNIDKPLSAILTLNSVAHTVGAAGVGAQAVNVFGEAYFGIISAVLTLLILIFSEIIPKTIGALYWRRLAGISTYFIRVTIIITYPFVLLSSVITTALSKNRKENSTSREEISALASIGVSEGIFHEKEYKIIQNLLRLKNLRVTEIMTPRVVVASASDNLSLDDFLKNKNYLNYSRIPVYSGDLENISGYVLRQTVFEKLAESHHELTLKDVKREIVIIPETTVLFDVWEQLLDKKEHIALIVDEYGGMEGIITMEDIIETILGLEIVDEKDTVPDMQKYARERWKIRQAKYRYLEQSAPGNSQNRP